MFVSTLKSGTGDTTPSSSFDVDSDDAETTSMSSQYTLELDPGILDTFLPLARVDDRDFLLAAKSSSGFGERGAGLLFLLYRDDEEAEDSLEDDEMSYEGGYDSDPASDDTPCFATRYFRGVVGDGSEGESEENELDEQTKVLFSRNQSWEHVWKPTTSDVRASPLFVRSQLDDLIGEVKPPESEDTQYESTFDVTSLPDDIHVAPVASSSNAARIAILLNTGERRRDPWNISLPTEVLFVDDPPHYSTPTLSEDFSVQDEFPGLVLLVRRSWGDAENAYYRAWNDPPLATVRDCFDLVQQLLEGVVFFHEQGLSSIPFSPSNIAMDVGLAPCPSPHGADRSPGAAPTPLDRATYPVKYYLASLDGLRFVSQDGSTAGTNKTLLGNVSEEYTRDVVNLGTLIKDIFSSIPGNPFEILYDFMLSPVAKKSSLAPNICSDDASVGIHQPPAPPLPTIRPTASSSLELLRFIEATYKQLGKSIVQQLEAPTLTPSCEGDRGREYSHITQTTQDNHASDEAHGVGVGELTHEKG